MEAGLSDSVSDAWLEQLRTRFTEITSRRVDPSAVEDIVQDALQVVLEKGAAEPRLDWCFQVLRNVIGNWYSREKTRRRFVVADPEGTADATIGERSALEALEGAELVGLLEAGAGSLGSPCSAYLEALMAGAAPADVAAREGLEAAVFYRRLYRCRKKLRDWLKTKGIEA